MDEALRELVVYAAKHSFYYRERLAGLIAQDYEFSKLPLTDQISYWQANTIKENQVLTSVHEDGIIFKSGGTTGNPKFSYYTQQEWAQTTAALAKGLNKNGLGKGDRVANLFYAGELYSSFIAVSDALAKIPGVVQYPLSGSAQFADILHTLQDFSVNVLIGTPTTIMRLAEYVAAQGVRDIGINKIFFAGETMYPDQRKTLLELWPQTVFRSSNYASVDAGVIAYADIDCGFNEHRCFDGYCLLELIDDDGAVIEEEGIEGKIVVTNLIRRLMPLIRYPAGDRGVWLEPKDAPGRKFKLLGRSDEGARIGPMTVYVQDVITALNSLGDSCKWSNFQLLIEHSAKMDRLTIRVQAEDEAKDKAVNGEKLRKAIYDLRPMFGDLLAKNLVHPLEIEWVSQEMMTINKRTGKMPKVLDLRFIGI